MMRRAETAQAPDQPRLQLLAHAKGFDRHDRAINRLHLSRGVPRGPRRDDRPRAAREVEHGDAGAAARNQLLQVAQCRFGDLLRRPRAEDVEEYLQAPIVLAQRLAGSLTFRDVTLNTEMAGNPAGLIVETEVVALNPDRRSVHSPFVGLD